MYLSTPDRLYKFLPSKYVGSVFESGHLLFRNFTYFRQTEGKTRGDYLEAHHRDNPDNDVRISNLDTGKTISGDFSFLNSTDSDKIFMFCLTTHFDENLYEEFECDSCIEITDVPTFIKRIRFALAKLALKHSKGLICRPVTYYAPNKPSGANIKDPVDLAFIKDQIYSHQCEYRLVFGTKKAFRLKQQIVANAAYDFRAAAFQGTPMTKQLRLGSLAECATIHSSP